MNLTELGSGMPARTRSSDFISQLQADITDAVMAEVRKAIQAMSLPAPVVHVAPAQVSVAPPVVNIDTPEPPTVNVEVPGIEDLAREQAQTNDLLRQVLVKLSQPVTKTVERDGAGWIMNVTETR
jgi:hypothetical protein